MKKNILIVDDHPIVSTGLQALIEHTGEYGKIYVTNNITSSRLLLRQKDIDIAIIDLELQDANGMELIKYIHQTHINTKILVYTMHEELWTIRQLMKEDADAIVMKGDNPQEVLIALRKIEQGKGYFSQQFMRLINNQDTSEITLSNREAEVLEHISNGFIHQRYRPATQHQQQHGGVSSSQPDEETLCQQHGTAREESDTVGAQLHKVKLTTTDYHRKDSSSRLFA